MGDFASGFAKGFFDTLNTDVRARTAAADDYFQKQVEIARTSGVANKRKTDALVGQSVTVAKQLQQMGVPKNLIMAIAAQNPGDLGGFYETVADASSKGVPLTPEFFNDFVDVSADYKAPNEDFQTFFARVYQPVAANYAADPEGFNRDRKGNIVATLLGFNAMDRARSRLGETQVADGMTAEQLLQYGDGAMPDTTGGPTVTFNYGAAEKYKPNSSESKPLDIESIRRLNEDLKIEFVEQRKNLGEGADEQQVKQNAINALIERYASDPRAVAELQRMSGVDPEGSGLPAITTSALPPSGEQLREAGIGVDSPAEAVGSPPEGQVASEATGVASRQASGFEAASMAARGGNAVAAAKVKLREDNSPIVLEKEPELANIISGYDFVKDNGDGTSTWKRPNGLVIMDNARVRLFANQ